MSKTMTLRSSAKPPLARSPIRLRTRNPLQPVPTNVIHSSPQGSTVKSQVSDRFLDVEMPDIRPEYQAMSCELVALTKLVHQELGARNSKALEGGHQDGLVFERGRFYDEYAARRNERLKRKKTEIEGVSEKKTGYDLGVRVQSAKKRDTSKPNNSQRKAEALVEMAAAIATPMPPRRETDTPTPRYSLRSSTRKENVKPLMMNVEKSAEVNERKVATRRSRKI